jgi:hypothetical protein
MYLHVATENMQTLSLSVVFVMRMPMLMLRNMRRADSWHDESKWMCYVLSIGNCKKEACLPVCCHHVVSMLWGKTWLLRRTLFEWCSAVQMLVSNKVALTHSVPHTEFSTLNLETWVFGFNTATGKLNPPTHSLLHFIHKWGSLYLCSVNHTRNTFVVKCESTQYMESIFPVLILS